MERLCQSQTIATAIRSVQVTVCMCLAHIQSCAPSPRQVVAAHAIGTCLVTSKYPQLPLVLFLG